MPTPYRQIGLLLACILALLAGLHAYWALGGRWGLAEALGGADRPVPPPWMIWFVAGLLLAAALVVLGRVGLWAERVPSWIFAVACWGVVVALFGAALINFAGDTIWERFGFGPFSLALALAAAYVATSPRRAA